MRESSKNNTHLLRISLNSWRHGNKQESLMIMRQQLVSYHLILYNTKFFNNLKIYVDSNDVNCPMEKKGKKTQVSSSIKFLEIDERYRDYNFSFFLLRSSYKTDISKGRKRTVYFHLQTISSRLPCNWNS